MDKTTKASRPEPPACAVLIPAEGDALCAAGALSLRHPEARVVVAHPRNLARLLMQVATRYGAAGRDPVVVLPERHGRPPRRSTEKPIPLPMEKTVHLVGLVPDGDETALRDGLIACRQAGIGPIWHDGRGALTPAARKTLSRHCRINAPCEAKTHTDAVVRHLGVERHARFAVLRDVAAFVQPPESSPPRRVRPGTERLDHADYVAALLEYAVHAQDVSAFTHHLRRWAAEGLQDDALASGWRGEGRPLEIDGHSPQIFALRDRIARIAPYDDATVLILGPSGSGKEVAASLIHRQSGRTGPFVAVNCATLAGEAGMVNARLFGHARGAFTGAVKEGRGVFEAAEGGTLLLDEVAELPLDTQARLLRVLEERTFTRLGEESIPRRAEVRVIAATHRDLGAMVRERRFRDDLLFRLNVLQVRVPALAERLQDIEDLAYTLYAKLGRKHHRVFPPLRPDHVATLRTYAWPGNVRQLRTILERALLLGMLDRLGELIGEERELYGRSAAGPLPIPSLTARPSGVTSTSANGISKPSDEILPLRENNRRYVEHVIRTMEGNHARAARALGISVNRLKRLSQPPMHDYAP